VGLGAGGPSTSLTGTLGTDATVHANNGGLDTVASLIPGLSARMAGGANLFGAGASIITPRVRAARSRDLFALCPR